MLRNIFSQRTVMSFLTEIASTPGLPQSLARKLCLQHRAQSSPSICYSWETQRGNLQFADICEVDKRRFLGPYSHNLGGLHDKFPLLSSHHVWVLFPHDVKNSIEQLQNKGFTPSEHLPFLKAPHLPKPPQTAFTVTIRLPLPKSISPRVCSAHSRGVWTMINIAPCESY